MLAPRGVEVKGVARNIPLPKARSDVIAEPVAAAVFKQN
jgi:hypothetical protein